MRLSAASTFDIIRRGSPTDARFPRWSLPRTSGSDRIGDPIRVSTPPPLRRRRGGIRRGCSPASGRVGLRDPAEIRGPQQPADVPDGRHPASRPRLPGRTLGTLASFGGRARCRRGGRPPRAAHSAGRHPARGCAGHGQSGNGGRRPGAALGDRGAVPAPHAAPVRRRGTAGGRRRRIARRGTAARARGRGGALRAHQDEARRADLRTGSRRPARAATQVRARDEGGGAQLLTGNVDASIATLQDAARLAPRDRDTQVDLAAALIARGQQRNVAADYQTALELLDALAGPVSREALFNRALALEGVGQRDEAATAWERYLAVDSGTGWADEARGRLAALQR